MSPESKSKFHQIFIPFLIGSLILQNEKPLSTFIIMSFIYPLSSKNSKQFYFEGENLIYRSLSCLSQVLRNTLRACRQANMLPSMLFSLFSSCFPLISRYKILKVLLISLSISQKSQRWHLST